MSKCPAGSVKASLPAVFGYFAWGCFRYFGGGAGMAEAKAGFGAPPAGEGRPIAVAASENSGVKSGWLALFGRPAKIGLDFFRKSVHCLFQITLRPGVFREPHGRGVDLRWRPMTSVWRLGEFGRDFNYGRHGEARGRRGNRLFLRAEAWIAWQVPAKTNWAV